MLQKVKKTEKKEGNKMDLIIKLNFLERYGTPAQGRLDKTEEKINNDKRNETTKAQTST